MLAGCAINPWPRRFLDRTHPTPTAARYAEVVARPGRRQPDHPTVITVCRQHLVPGLETVAGQERPSAGQQLHHLARPAPHGSVSTSLVARDWQAFATHAPPWALAAAVEPAGRDGGRQRLAMTAPCQQVARQALFGTTYAANPANPAKPRPA